MFNAEKQAGMVLQVIYLIFDLYNRWFNCTVKLC